MKVTRVRGSGPGRSPRALRTIVHYVATCKDCDELPEGPKAASVHVKAKGHTVVETKSYHVTQVAE